MSNQEAHSAEIKALITDILKNISNFTHLSLNQDRSIEPHLFETIRSYVLYSVQAILMKYDRNENVREIEVKLINEVPDDQSTSVLTLQLSIINLDGSIENY